MSNERTFDKKWGEFYDGLKKTTKLGMMYNYVFIVYRFSFVCIAFYWYDHVALQLAVFTLTSQFYCMYLWHTKPFVDYKVNIQEIFNEVTVMCVIYHCLCFTDFVLDAGAKF